MFYIKMAIAEAKLARVPNQLLSPTDVEDGNGKEEDETDENVNEFSSCGSGGIVGYSGPLGIDPDELGRKKNTRKKRR